MIEMYDFLHCLLAVRSAGQMAFDLCCLRNLAACHLISSSCWRDIRLEGGASQLVCGRFRGTCNKLHFNMCVIFYTGRLEIWSGFVAPCIAADAMREVVESLAGQVSSMQRGSSPPRSRCWLDELTVTYVQPRGVSKQLRSMHSTVWPAPPAMKHVLQQQCSSISRIFFARPYA